MIKENQAAQFKATEYLFDLGNTALENGFKPDERWEVSLSTAEQKKEIEKQYYPTVATLVLPELLSATFNLVKTHLKQAMQEQVLVIQDRFADQPVYQYLIAFNPNRLRR